MTMSATARPCLDCGRVTTAGSRCQACGVAHTRARDQQRGTPAQRGYGAAWRRLSTAAVAAQPWCSLCGSTEDLTTDHIVPLAAGGVSEAGNVRVLCRPCNSRKGARVEAGAPRG